MTAMAPCRRANANRRLIGGILLTTLLFGLPYAVIAKKSDRLQNMNYDAQHLDGANLPNSITTLTGHVKLTQGTMLMTGDVAKIYLDADQQVARVVVTGKPAHIQELDENNNLMTGDALTLDYDNINQIAVLTTNAVVNQQCRGEFHGDRLTYNQNTSVITGETGGSDLVHGIILPKNAPKPTACAKPPTAQAVPDGEPVAGKLPTQGAAKPAKGK